MADGFWWRIANHFDAWCFVKFDARVGTLGETHTVTKCYEPHREDGRNYRENRIKTKVFRRCVVCAQNWDNLKIGAVIWFYGF